MSAQQALALPLPAASNTVVINARCSLRVEADQRVIVLGGLPVHHYRAEDAVAEAYAMVFLVESAFAQQMDVARAFGRSGRTVRRHQGTASQHDPAAGLLMATPRTPSRGSRCAGEREGEGYCRREPADPKAETMMRPTMDASKNLSGGTVRPVAGQLRHGHRQASCSRVGPAVRGQEDRSSFPD